MAFGIKRSELLKWKDDVKQGKIAILTHYWEDNRFPNCTSVTKIGCSDIKKLIKWGELYGLCVKWIHYSKYPHFDVFGDKQWEILCKEGKNEQIKRFKL